MKRRILICIAAQYQQKKAIQKAEHYFMEGIMGWFRKWTLKSLVLVCMYHDDDGRGFSFEHTLLSFLLLFLKLLVKDRKMIALV